MSNEISYQLALKYAKNSSNVAISSGVRHKDVSGNNLIDVTLDLTTSWEAIPKADIATVGTLVVENLGSQAVELRNDLTGDPWLVVKPGQMEKYHLSNTGFPAPAARSAASTTRARFILIED